MNEIEFIEQFLGMKLKLYQKILLKSMILRNKYKIKTPYDITVIKYMLKRNQ